MSKLKVCIVNPDGKTISEFLQVKEIEDELHEYYQIIGCDDIECPVREIKGHSFRVVVDGEGLLKGNLQITAFSPSNFPFNPYLVGICVFVGREDKDGKFQSLTDEEITLIHTAINQIEDGLYVMKLD